jgi:hypothetical protein
MENFRDIFLKKKIFTDSVNQIIEEYWILLIMIERGAMLKDRFSYGGTRVINFPCVD